MDGCCRCCFLSLFIGSPKQAKSILSPRHWGTVSGVAFSCLIVYVFLSYFAILNVVTGVCLDCLMVVTFFDILNLLFFFGPGEHELNRHTSWFLPRRSGSIQQPRFCNNAIESSKADKDSSSHLSIHKQTTCFFTCFLEFPFRSDRHESQPWAVPQ